MLAGFRARHEDLIHDSVEDREAARDTLLRLVATAEIFASELVLDVTERRLPVDEFIARIWDERSRRVVRDWPSRKSAWKDLFDVKWNYAKRDELQGFVSARNIIAHGIGRLTRSQLERGRIRQGVVDELARAGLRLDGYRLVVDAVDVERCGRCVLDFIAWLDTEAKSSAMFVP